MANVNETKRIALEAVASKKSFMLSAEEFQNLTKIPSRITFLNHAVIGVALTYAVSIGARLAYNHLIDPNSGEPVPVQNFEWLAVSISFVVALALAVLAYRFPSSRRKAEKKIQKHFDDQLDPADTWSQHVSREN